MYTFSGWHTVARNDLDERSDRNRVEPKRNPKCNRFIDFFYLEYGSCVGLSLSLYVCAAAAAAVEEKKERKKMGYVAEMVALDVQSCLAGGYEERQGCFI